MSLTSKFYCKKCKKIKTRFQVRHVDRYYHYAYECKYCHEDTERLEHMLVRLDQELHDKELNVELHNLKGWISKEAIKRYPNDSGRKKAFKEGIYALLDKIGFEYEEE